MIKDYLLVTGNELVDASPILFVSDGVRTTVYCEVPQVATSYQRYVDHQDDVTMEKLSSRFSYYNTEFGAPSSDKQAQLEQMIAEYQKISAKPV
jgi:hypothetical protein